LAKFKPFVTDFPKPVAVPKPPKRQTGGILEDPGLLGQNLGAGGLGKPTIANPVIGTYAGQQIYQPPGNLASGTVIGAGQWGNQGWAAQPGRDYSPGPDYTAGLGEAIAGSPFPAAKPKPPPPGYYSTLFDDPLYQAAIANYTARLQGGRNLLRSQLQNAVIQSGYIPSYADNPDLQGYADDLDQATIDRAQGNQLSQKAQLEKQQGLDLNDINYQLAARGEGLLGGGTQQVATNLLQNRYTLARNQQMQSLIDALRGNITDYGTLGETAGQDLLGAARETATRLAQSQGPTWDLSTAAPEAAAAYGIAAPTTLASAAGEQGPVTWGGQQFMSKQGLTDFLNRFTRWGGITPEMFAATHPAAWGRLT
jgi:hypothetical protein